MVKIPKIKNGLAEIGWWPITYSDTGVRTDGDIVKFPGSRQYGAEPQGESEDLFADGQNVYTDDTNDGYLISLEMLNIDKVAAAWLGDVVNETAGTRDEYNIQVRPPFGLVIMNTTTNGTGEIEFYFNCMATKRPSKSGKTKEKKAEYAFDNIEIKARAREDGLVLHYERGTTMPTKVPVVVKPTPVTPPAPTPK